MASGADAAPKRNQQPRNMIPVNSSTRKYRIDIGAPQFRQRPRNITQVSNGTLRNQGMEYLQCGQCDGEKKPARYGSSWIDGPKASISRFWRARRL